MTPLIDPPVQTIPEVTPPPAAVPTAPPPPKENHVLEVFERIMLDLAMAGLQVAPLFVHSRGGSILLNAGAGLAGTIVSEFQHTQSVP